MKYPAMTIKSATVSANASKIAELAAKQDIEVWGVTKVLAGNPELARLYIEAGFKGICDSRMDNLRKIKRSGLDARRQLIRIAMPSELKDLPRYADVSLQSEIETILSLDLICMEEDIDHDVLITLDVGDLREGFLPREIRDIGMRLRSVERVRLAGVAANFACASGVLPTGEKLAELVSYRDELQNELGIKLPVISVGGTCCLKAIEEGYMPAAVNQLRIGEGALLGFDTAYQRRIDWLADDAVTLLAEIVECRYKPSVPTGEVGLQAFGEKPVFVDRGMRKRALLAMGRQDMNLQRITPIAEGIELVTGSSDHTIIDVTEADSVKSYDKGHRAGNIVAFRPAYPAVLAASTSPYFNVYFE